MVGEVSVGKIADSQKRFRSLRAAATPTIVVPCGPEIVAKFTGAVGGTVGGGVANFSGAERLRMVGASLATR